MHIVRSEAFEACRNTVYHCNSENLVDVVASDTRLRDRFIAVRGRPPEQQELESMVRDYATQLEDSRRGFVGSMMNAYNTIVEMLSKYRIQIVQSIPALPGFVWAMSRWFPRDSPGPGFFGVVGQEAQPELSPIRRA